MNAYYRLYIKSIIKLVATLVIKSSYTADMMNRRLLKAGIAVDLNDPTTWKYYRNNAGLYHSSNVMMQVTSLDDNTIIDFTQANLKIHAATRKEYTYGSSYYKELVAAYPNQQMLINGIINPIDIGTAIQAADHTILKYDASLVEASEQQLIPDIQRYITHCFKRWDNSDYALFEPFYYPAFLGILYTRLPQVVINSRKAVCKTDQAHSYHLRQYISSFNEAVGNEFDLMTLKQKLFTYRNIRYLNLNLGRGETFDLITQKYLTDRGFSLAGYDLEHDYERLTIDLKPLVVFVRKTINGIEPAMGSSVKSPQELLELETPLARDNIVIQDDVVEDVFAEMNKFKGNKLKTKVLESNVVDRTDAEPFTLTEVLLNHWIYLSHYSRFNSVVVFTNPANGDLYRLSVKNAFIFYLYAYNRSIGQKLSHVPIVNARRVRRIPLPTKAKLMSMTTRKKVPEYYIDYILDTQVQIGTYVSIEAFRDTCKEIQALMLHHRDMRNYNGDYKAEGELHAIIDHCYMDIRIDLAGEMNYDNWLNSVGIDITGMGDLEFSMMADQIFNTATGSNLSNATRVREVHAAMLRVMTALSSYTVQYIGQINDSPIKIVDGKFPKLSVPKEWSDSYYDVENPLPTIMNLHENGKMYMEQLMPYPKVNMTARDLRVMAKVPADVGIKLVGSIELKQQIDMPLPRMTLIESPQTDIGEIVQTDVTGYLAIPDRPLGDLIIDDNLVGYELLTEARRKNFLGI